MGEWNATCMLTDLPIKPGEHVYAVLLAQRRTKGCTSRPNEIWMPITPFIPGIYDGFGGVQDIDKTDDSLIMRGLDNAYKDRYFNLTDDHGDRVHSLEDAIGLAQDDRLTLYHDTHILWDNLRKYPASIAILSKDALDILDAGIRMPLLSEEDIPMELMRLSPILLYYETSPRMLLCTNIGLLKLRRTWHPTQNCGDQSDVEDSFRVNWQKAVATLAEAKYFNYTRTACGRLDD